MNPELERLSRLADLDDAITARERELEAARAAAPEARARAAQAEVARAAIAAELAAHAAKERAGEREIELYRTRLARAVQALETGAGDAAAAERQRVQCVEILDRLETELLELLEARDGIAGRLAAADEALAARRAEISAAEVATAPAVDAATAALVELRAERDALRPAIEAHELARYDQLRGRGRRPVSAIVDKACKACRRGLIPHQLHELARGRLERCGGCGRWLLPPE